MKPYVLKHLFLDALKKEYRSKTFIVLIVFTILVVFISKGLIGFIQQTAEDQAGSFGGELIGAYSLNIFYVFIDMWSILIATIIGINTLKSDMTYRVGVQILSFPIKRSVYLLSRLLGGWSIVTGYYLFSLLFAGILFSLTSEEFLFKPELFLALLNSSLIVMGTLIFAMGFSLFLPRMMAFVANLLFVGVIFAANGSYFSQTWAESLQDMNITGAILLFFHWFFPKFAVLNSFTSKLLFRNSSFEVGEYLFSLGHFILFVILWAWIFSLIFKRRDL